MAEMRFELDMDLHTRFKVVCAEGHMTMVAVVREMIEKFVDEGEKYIDQIKFEPKGAEG